jgi:hypothetical protein
VSAFPTVVGEAAFRGPAGEFVLTTEPHSEIAALSSAQASAPAQLPAPQRASDNSLRVRLSAALDKGQRQRDEIARPREELALAHGRDLELDRRVRRT